jgi:hypothetical protein
MREALLPLFPFDPGANFEVAPPAASYPGAQEKPFTNNYTAYTISCTSMLVHTREQITKKDNSPTHKLCAKTVKKQNNQ